MTKKALNSVRRDLELYAVGTTRFHFRRVTCYSFRRYASQEKTHND